MICSRDLIEIGVVQKPHGIQGELVLSLDRDVEFESVAYVIMEIDGLWVPFFIDSYRPRGVESVLVKLEGVDSDTDAGELSRHTVYLLRSQLPDEDASDDDDEITADKLIGYTLYDDDAASESEAKEVGVVEAIREMTPANWLFEVRATDGRELLIPIATDLITGIDAESQALYMELPTGLTDL
jgi:16S rRNA processing protein RimM